MQCWFSTSVSFSNPGIHFGTDGFRDGLATGFFDLLNDLHWFTHARVAELVVRRLTDSGTGWQQAFLIY